MGLPPSAAAKWRWCAIASLVMVLLSLLPQIHLWIVRGRDWNGAYTSLQGDEFLYSAYINALMDGRPRRYDPFAGPDGTSPQPLQESTFSIQLVPAYVISFLAKVTGASASTAFIVLIGVAALLASVSVFFLIKGITGDHQLAAAGTLFVLCFGGPAGGQGFFGLVVKSGLLIPGFPFLRRYQPAAAFALFFLFNFFVWRALTIQDKRRVRVLTLLGGCVLATLVFSYLYLWTAAAAWLACIGLLWFCCRPMERRKVLGVVGTIYGVTALALVPYAYLLSNRAGTLDEQQTLVATHQLDLLRIPEILGVLIMIALGSEVWRNRIQRNDPRLIFTASLALLPFVVFNQQLLTGKTMQPYHYEAFIVNYCVLIAVLLTAALFWHPPPKRLLIWTSALAISWGVVEVGLPARLTSVPAAVTNDQIIPVLQRLKELGKQDGTRIGSGHQGSPLPVVFSPYVAVNVLLPTWTSQGTLLDIGGLDLGNVSREQRKGFLYLHLYLSKVDAPALREPLNARSSDVAMNYYARSAIFGHERMLPGMSLNFTPITQAEIEEEIRAYQAYVDSFSRANLLKRPLGYAVIRADGKFDFTNLDRWYERDAGERIGEYILFRLKLRNEAREANQ